MLTLLLLHSVFPRVHYYIGFFLFAPSHHHRVGNSLGLLGPPLFNTKELGQLIQRLNVHPTAC